MAERKHFTGITSDAFVSDADKWALDKLKKVPLMPQLVSKFYEYGIDRWMYAINMSMSVRCGPTQYGSLYSMLRESCAVLDMPEPELYITNNPFPNAWAGGVERPFITLRSSIVNNLTDEQLYHLIGHELGHIKAEHVLYFSVGAVLIPLLEMLGRRTLGWSDLATQALILAFYEWSRQAEFSADRAGLLVAQELNTSIDAMIRLTAGQTRFDEELSREAYMEQARTYQDGVDQVGKALIWLFIGKYWTHPMPVHRAQQLERWHQSGAFDRIMAGNYDRMPKEKAG
jgi:Zn-dependent protease with chaperone function